MNDVVLYEDDLVYHADIVLTQEWIDKIGSRSFYFKDSSIGNIYRILFRKESKYLYNAETEYSAKIFQPVIDDLKKKTFDNVLLMGLGTGELIKKIREFSNCSITVLERDSHALYYRHTVGNDDYNLIIGEVYKYNSFSRILKEHDVIIDDISPKFEYKIPFIKYNTNQFYYFILIQMYSFKPFKDLTPSELRKGEIKMEHYFKFVDNQKRYTPDELLNVFHSSNTDNYLIDPFNGLKTAMSYSSNYDVLNDLKHFTKSGKTIYVNTHPSSASGRRSAIYPEKHAWAGHVMPPLKSDIEGGKAFANKADDFIVIHRMTQHPEMWNQTMCEIVKIKDTDTGGMPTKLNTPVLLDYNKGLGFRVGGVDCIKRKNIILNDETEGMKPNTNFDNLPF